MYSLILKYFLLRHYKTVTLLLRQYNPPFFLKKCSAVLNFNVIKTYDIFLASDLFMIVQELNSILFLEVTTFSRDFLVECNLFCIFLVLSLSLSRSILQGRSEG